MTIETDIKPSGIESGVVYAPFDKGKAELEEADFQIISMPKNAELRIQQGKDAFVSKNGNWVREGVLYIPGKGNYLTRHSSILQSAEETTQAHGNGKEFYPTQEQVDLTLKEYAKFPERNISIPVERFGEDELTVFVIGNGDSKKAQNYGNFLKDAGIPEMPICVVGGDYVKAQGKPFERLLWFYGLDVRSYLGGDVTYLCGGDVVRGVREISD